MVRRRITIDPLKEREILESRYEKAKNSWINDKSKDNLFYLASSMHNLNIIDKKIHGVF